MQRGFVFSLEFIMNTGTHFRRAAACLLAGGAILAATIPASEAQSVTASIQSVSAPSGTKAAPFYVIDADAASGAAGYDRDTFTTDVTVRFSLAGGYTNGSETFRVSVQLVDSLGNPAALAGTSSRMAYSSSQVVSLNKLTTPAIRSFSVTIDPGEDLGAGRSYHLKVSVWRLIAGKIPHWTGSAGPQNSDSFVVVHFTGPNASDLARNVRGYTTGAASWARSYAVATDPDKDKFVASVPYRLMRYDAGENWAISTVIGIVLDVDLFDETGAEIPLENDGRSSTSVSMRPFGLGWMGNPTPPWVDTGSFNASFRPTANLDSANHRYRATVNVKHVETLGLPVGTMIDDGTEEAPLRHLLHFNGTLLWGSLATTMGSVSNDPVVNGFGSGYIASQIKVDGKHGAIPTRPDLQFGSDAWLSVRLFSDGHAEVFSGKETVTTAPGGGRVIAEFAGIKVVYNQTQLSKTGPHALGATLWLPQGLGYTPDVVAARNRFERFIEFAGEFSLDSNFRHTALLSFNPAAGAAVFDEARPLVYDIGLVEFSTTGKLTFKSTGPGGITYCHGAAFDQLESDESNGYHESASMAVRMTNDGYLRHVDFKNAEALDYTAAHDGSARLGNAPMVVEPGHFTAHFPMGAEIEWNGTGGFSFLNGGIRPGGMIVGAASIVLPFDGSCPKDKCAGAGKAEVSVSLRPQSEKLHFSSDGSLHAEAHVTPIQLEWGLRSDGHGGFDYSHRTDQFRNGIFDMAGQFGYASENPAMASGLPWRKVAADLFPGSVLFAGCDLSNEAHLVYPASAEYLRGDGFYAGCNFVAKEDIGGASRIGGATSDYGYTLMNEVSKYYVRRGGLSGRHAPADGSYSGKMRVYGYDFQVTLFQLTFLSNQNVLSWFNGAVSVPEPADFTQAFKGLALTCTGDLDQGEIDPEDPGPKPLRYWNGEFMPHVVMFSEIPGSGTPCYPDRALVLGLSTEVAHVPGTLSGNLAFTNKGNIATPSMGIAGAEGRLGLPSAIRLDGPGEEEYTLVPCTKLYFNNPDHDPNAGDGAGFVTFAGTMNVPWFEDLEVQMLTSASSTGSPEVYLTGGWEEPANHTFFTDADFDPENTGYPEGGIDLDTYKNLPVGADYTKGHDIYSGYRVTAEQSLFGLVPLAYPLEWKISGRYFKSAYPMTDDLVVLHDLFHQVDYMSAERLDVSFGAKYDGMPRINIVGAAFEAADEQIGAARALADAAKGVVAGALTDGADEIDKLLSDTMEDLIDQMLDQMETSVIDPLHGAMAASYQTASSNGETLDQWLATLDGQFDQYLKGSAGGGHANSMRGKLDQLAQTTGGALSMVNRAKSAVEKGIVAIDSVSGEVRTILEGGVEVPVYEAPPGSASGATYPGILATDASGQRQIVQKLVKALIKRLAGEEIADAMNQVMADASRGFDEKLAELLSDADPTLDQLVDVLGDLRAQLEEMRTALADGGEILESFQQIVTLGETELDTVVADVCAEARAYITRLAASAHISGGAQLNQYGSLFDDFSPESFRSLVSSELRDLLLKSEVYREFQYVLRQWIYDLDIAMRNAIDSMFAEVQQLVQNVIQEALGPLDDAINGLLGSVGDYLGAGSIQGSAQFNGDSLKRLRIDGEFQFKIPDDMELHAYLEILQYTSGDEFPASACLAPGEKALEVKLGATDVGLDWISPDMRADMEVKFSMETSSGLKPKGVGGSFEMTGGSLNFEAFKITEFVASVGVGTDECYIAAAARMEFSSYEMAGGIFFGRTCSIEPLEKIDKDVAELLGSGSFSGAYVYGEVWLPISEIVLGIPASCMFNISAGVGAGAFYFLEGPTWGGQMLLGVSGEALCVVSIKGSVKMIGVMKGNSLSFTGRGSLKGKAGACPFCVKFSKSAKIGYQDGDWSIDL